MLVDYRKIKSRLYQRPGDHCLRFVDIITDKPVRAAPFAPQLIAARNEKNVAEDIVNIKLSVAKYCVGLILKQLCGENRLVSSLV